MSTPIPIPEWAYQAADAVNRSLDLDVFEEGIAVMAARIAEAHHRSTQTITCAFCGHEYPPGTPTSQADLLSQHIRVCAKHPMRAAEARIAELEGQVKAYQQRSGLNLNAWDGCPHCKGSGRIRSGEPCACTE